MKCNILNGGLLYIFHLIIPISLHSLLIYGVTRLLLKNFKEKAVKFLIISEILYFLLTIILNLLIIKLKSSLFDFFGSLTLPFILIYFLTNLIAVIFSLRKYNLNNKKIFLIYFIKTVISLIILAIIFVFILYAAAESWTM